MKWTERRFEDGSGTPWLECEMPLGLCYSAERMHGKRKWFAVLVSGNGDTLWETWHSSQAKAVWACEAHAERVAKDWIIAVGEGE